MVKKLTTEKFIKKAKEKHGDKYDYSLVDYTNNSTKVKVICKEHRVFEQKPNHHLLGSGCQKCSAIVNGGKCRKSSNNFLLKAIEIHGELYDYSLVKYTISHSKVNIVCKEHGIFSQKPYKHLSGQGCPKCSYVLRGKTKSSNVHNFITKAKEKHGDKYDYSLVDYTNNSTKVKIICKEHGIFIQTPHSHLRGNGCQKCGYLSNSNKFKYSTQEFINKSKEVHGEQYEYSEIVYVNSVTKVNIICKKHGVFQQRPSAHLKGHGCKICNNILQTSKPAQQWIDYLLVSQPNIQHFHSELGEFTVPNSQYKADGYDEESNTIYEFNGDYWHGNPILYDQDDINKVTKTMFKELYEKTLRKEEFCKSQGYNYVSLWEYDWNRGINAIIHIQRRFRQHYSINILAC